MIIFMSGYHFTSQDCFRAYIKKNKCSIHFHRQVLTQFLSMNLMQMKYRISLYYLHDMKCISISAREIFCLNDHIVSLLIVKLL